MKYQLEIIPLSNFQDEHLEVFRSELELKNWLVDNDFKSHVKFIYYQGFISPAGDIAIWRIQQ